MAQSTNGFAKKHRNLLAAALALAVPFFAIVAEGRAEHAVRSQPSTPVAETSDYLAWHQQEASAVELDSLSGSLRLFSTIADKLAADAR
jgi:hypothetical protein